MKKSLVLAMALAMGVTASAYAANPFSDVPAGHWAYDAVDKLAAAGVIDGMGNGQFEGDKTMTRYEMAQIVAKAMAKGANVEKLAAEFADELDQLGVRVAKLEKKSDNVKISGEFRYKYKSLSPKYNVDDEGVGHSFETNLRTRLFVDGQINEDWTYHAQIQNEQDLATASGDNGVDFRRAYVEGKLFGLNVVAGHADYGFGDGNVLDDDLDADVIAVNYGSKINVELSAGKVGDGEDPIAQRFYGGKLTYAPTDNFTAKFEYAQFKDIGNDNSGNDAKIYDLDLDYVMGDFDLNAMYIHGDKDTIADADKESNGWVIGLGYKGADPEAVGSWGLSVKYYNQGTQTYLAHAIDGTTDFDDEGGFKGWSFGGDLTLAKNTVLTLAYYDTESKQNSDRKDHVMWTDLTFSF